MKLFLDYINKIKFYIILQLFPVILAEIIFFLYQLPLEPMVYVTVFWLITGICACLNGFYRYRKKVEQLELIAAAPDINLSQMDSPVGQDERFQQEIMQQLNQMRIDVENASQKASEDMTDYYTMCLRISSFSAVLLTGSYVIRFINMQEFLSQRNSHLLMKVFRRMF